MAIEAMKKRRSIRRYEETAVSEEQIREILEAARLAPSWANKQTWEFLVIRDPEKLQMISDVLEGNPAKKSVVQAPVLLVVCADPSKSGVQNDKEYYMTDIGIVMDHIMLQAADMGLGTVFIGWYDEEKVRKVLDIPKEFRIVAMTPIGYPQKMPAERAAKELDEMVHWERW